MAKKRDLLAQLEGAEWANDRLRKENAELKVKLSGMARKADSRDKLFSLFCASYMDFKRKWYDALDAAEREYYGEADSIVEEETS